LITNIGFYTYIHGFWQKHCLGDFNLSELILPFVIPEYEHSTKPFFGSAAK
jgi:hypothetical protein